MVLRTPQHAINTMDSEDPLSAAPLLRISDDCLARVLSFLDLGQRVRAGAVCRRLRSVSQSAGPLLWDHITYSNPQPCLPSLRAWLAAHAASAHGGCTRNLSLHATSLEESWEAAAAVLRLSAPSLEALELSWPSKLITGDWLAGASRLTRLLLLARGLVCGSALGSLGALRTLTLESWDNRVELQGRYCLPTSLTWLFLVDAGLSEAPEVLTGLTALQSLYLSRNPLDGQSLTRLARLPALRALSLIECFTGDPPQELSALTQLSMLYLDYNFGDVLSDGALRPCLASLSGLRVLGLSHTCLEEWPSTLEGLTSLQVLYLERTSIPALPPPATPLLRALRMLSLDFEPFLASVPLLREARALRTLYLGGAGAAAGGDAEQALAVLRGLLPPAGSLERIIIVVHSLTVERQSLPVMCFLLALGRACPGLQVEAIDSERFFGVTLDELRELVEGGEGVRGGASAGAMGSSVWPAAANAV